MECSNELAPPVALEDVVRHARHGSRSCSCTAGEVLHHPHWSIQVAKHKERHRNASFVVFPVHVAVIRIHLRFIDCDVLMSRRWRQLERVLVTHDASRLVADAVVVHLLGNQPRHHCIEGKPGVPEASLQRVHVGVCSLNRAKFAQIRGAVGGFSRSGDSREVFAVHAKAHNWPRHVDADPLHAHRVRVLRGCQVQLQRLRWSLDKAYMLWLSQCNSTRVLVTDENDEPQYPRAPDVDKRPDAHDTGRSAVCGDGSHEVQDVGYGLVATTIDAVGSDAITPEEAGLWLRVLVFDVHDAQVVHHVGRDLEAREPPRNVRVGSRQPRVPRIHVFRRHQHVECEQCDARDGGVPHDALDGPAALHRRRQDWRREPRGQHARPEVADRRAALRRARRAVITIAVFDVRG
jgi:hypothetical protein